MRWAEFASLTVTDLYNTRFDLDAAALKKNRDLWRGLLKDRLSHQALSLQEGVRAFVTSEIPHAIVVEVLQAVVHSAPWEKHRLFLNFISGKECSTEVWRVIMPQLVHGENGYWKSDGLPDLTIIERRWDDRGVNPALEKKIIGAVADPKHRSIAKILCGNLDVAQPNGPNLSALSPEVRAFARENLGVILLYPVAINGVRNETPVMGYECILGRHPIKYAFRVRDPRVRTT
jgi:hypothetical protein